MKRSRDELGIDQTVIEDDTNQLVGTGQEKTDLAATNKQIISATDSTSRLPKHQEKIDIRYARKVVDPAVLFPNLRDQLSSSFLCTYGFFFLFIHFFPFLWH